MRANFVGKSVVSAMTHTPASGPLGPFTTPPMSCACARKGAAASRQTIRVLIPPPPQEKKCEPSLAGSTLARHPFQILGPGVVGARADDLAVGALLQDVRRPPRGARDDEERREHRRGDAQHVI